MIVLNKDNVFEEVTKYLKENKVQFVYEDSVYEIIVGSESCYIQVEIIGGDEQDKSVFMQFYDSPEEQSLYEESDDISSMDEFEVQLEQMMTFVRDKIKKISKILNHINSIRDICEELDVESDLFIDVMYDFSNYE